MKKFEGELSEDILTREKYVMTRPSPDCPSITEGMETDVTYVFDEDNWYRVADRWWSFVDWVGTLSNLVGPDEELSARESTVAFHEIFEYGSHLGAFGPVACKKLAEDFALWDGRARTFADQDFYDTFYLMRKMFEFGAEGGACWLRSS